MEQNIPSYKKLEPAWAKAALLGSMWGSIEIIVGSFLHNLRVPLAGTILSAIGVSLLVAGHSLWKEKGLIWRAGLVCALMKSISPSAVLMGPMAGIMAEAIVLEIFVRLSRGASIGIVLGSGIAVCLPFVQTIISLLIAYGSNIAALYVEIYRIIAKSTGIGNVGAYGALGIFFSLNALFGFCASFLGMAIGKKAAAGESGHSPKATGDALFSLPPVSASQRFSIVMLAGNAVLIPLMLMAIGVLPLQWSSAVVCAHTLVMTAWYPNSRKRFSKPRIWIGMIVITALSGLLLGGITNKQPGWAWSGVRTGLQMSLRAVFMVAAFNAVSVELRNPKIINWVLRRGLGQLATAMEAAFDALPTLVAALGEQRDVLRHPVASISRLFLVARDRMEQLRFDEPDRGHVFMITGSRGAGKTELLDSVVEELRKRNRHPGGILSPVVRNESGRIGYDVVNIKTGERSVLCRNTPGGGEVRVGDWAFADEGIRFGSAALDPASLAGCDVIIVDEVGPLELEGKVWSFPLDTLMGRSKRPLIMAVRESLIEPVQTRWNFTPDHIWKIESHNFKILLHDIVETMINR